jgi:hypothetical protein
LEQLSTTITEKPKEYTGLSLEAGQIVRLLALAGPATFNKKPKKNYFFFWTPTKTSTNLLTSNPFHFGRSKIQDVLTDCDLSHLADI